MFRRVLVPLDGALYFCCVYHFETERDVFVTWYYGIRSGTEAKALKDGLGRTEMTGQTTQAQAR